jgi:hypothetical protein
MMINLTVQFSPEPVEQVRTETFAWDKANWPLFQGHLLGSASGALSLLNQSLGRKWDQDGLDNLYEKLHRYIEQALRLSVPIIKSSDKRRFLINSWWNEDCRVAVKAKKTP